MEPSNSPPPILDYHTPTKSIRRSAGGLALMGGAILLFALLPVGLAVITSMPFSVENLISTLILLLIAAWGIFYIVAAATICRGKTTLAPIALVMVVLQTLYFLPTSIIMVVKYWTNEFSYGLATPLILTVLVLVINLGFAAVTFELTKVIRQSRLPDMPPPPSPPQDSPANPIRVN